MFHSSSVRPLLIGFQRMQLLSEQDLRSDAMFRYSQESGGQPNRSLEVTADHE